MAKLGKNVGKSHEDKLLAFYYKSLEYYEANKNRVYLIVTSVIVVVALIFFYFNYKTKNNETAGIELSKVKMVYSSGLYLQAINGDSLGMSKGLQYLVDNYGSSENGEIAKVMLANCYYSLRDFDKAEKYYKDYSGSNDIYKAASYAGVASVYEAKNDFANASSYYMKASRQSKLVTNNDEYMFYAIKNYSLANDTENLKKTIKELKKDYPKSKYIAQLNRYDKGE
ncbi:MAG: tetratricopeptide repeat protein [Ignavibacteriae bacterium]|nr:tetratricopeptide repeat protein [Ignavibacteriota bacterium]